MERKIGEIFEFGGEWYQCIPDTADDSCNNCFFQKSCSNITGDCSSTARSDGKSVAFKKLEKVGEPYDDCGTILQRFKIHTKVTNADTKGLELHIYFNDTIGIEIKQTKEDMEDLGKIKVRDYTKVEELNVMEEKKLNLKPFDIQKAREGKPVCTRDGRKARVICFDRDWDMHIVALVAGPFGEEVHFYLSNGKVDFNKQSNDDLIMLPEKKEGWINVYKLNTCYSSKEEAEANIDRDYENEYIRTIKINWEE